MKQHTHTTHSARPQRVWLCAVLLIACALTLTACLPDGDGAGGSDATSSDSTSGTSGTSSADTSGTSGTTSADTSGSSGTDTSGSSGTDTSGSSGGDDPFGMVAAHNEVRQNASPTPSSPLPDMVWSDELTALSQEWADGCVFEHDQNNQRHGENLYVASWQADGPEAVVSWAEEVADYDYNSNSCTPNRMCGHYTQIVWRDSTEVGCAFKDCAFVEGAGFGGRLWVCRYNPPGNYVGERPY